MRMVNGYFSCIDGHIKTPKKRGKDNLWVILIGWWRFWILVGLSTSLVLGYLLPLASEPIDFPNLIVFILPRDYRDELLGPVVGIFAKCGNESTEFGIVGCSSTHVFRIPQHRGILDTIGINARCADTFPNGSAEYLLLRRT